MTLRVTPIRRNFYMKLTKTNVFVALLALTVFSSAVAAPTGGGKSARETRRSGRTETDQTTRDQRAQELRQNRQLVSDISNGLRIANEPALQSLGIKPENIVALNNATARALTDGLLGSQAKRVLQDMIANPTPAHKALFANIQILAAKNMLDYRNTRWEEVVDGQKVAVDSMEFIMGEALNVARTGSESFVRFLALKSELEKKGTPTKEAIKQALSILKISYEDFVKLCLRKA